jgi:hypothetical protein
MGDVSMQAPIRSSHGCWDLPDLSQKPLHTVTKKNRDCRQPPGPTVAARNPSADIKTRSFPLPPLRCWPRNIITFSFPGKKTGRGAPSPGERDRGSRNCRSCFLEFFSSSGVHPSFSPGDEDGRRPTPGAMFRRVHGRKLRQASLPS